ncbi:MAG: hypothetical protein WD934_02380 [Gemmatimonadales bacterium]
MTAEMERRNNRALREVLDDLVDHVRYITRNISTLTPDELQQAQDRLEWLADEVWYAAVVGDEEV